MPAEELDLFGKPVIGQVKGPKRKGYAAPPGTGPVGQTCRTCKHFARRRSRYLKCGLMRAHWTGGTGTDILAKSPACRCWEPYK